MRAFTAAFLLVVGCVGVPDHDEPSDFDLVGAGTAAGLPSPFDRDQVMSQDYFDDENYASADQLQLLLENTPYGSGTRSWLANEYIENRRAIDVLVSVAQENDINPLMLLPRMPVEQSLVGKADRPAQERIDRAFGCGCPGGSACAPQYLGLEKQMRCAGKTLANRRRDSVNGVGRWIAGVPWRSLEGLKVKPKNHGTAALYAYTPWVGIENGNGNWLVWNVTRKLDSKLRELMGW